MSVKKVFIEKLAKVLNEEQDDLDKPLDICYMVSVVDQHLDRYSEFIEEISNNNYLINGYDKDNTGGYTNGRIRILIEKPEEETKCDYCYFIEFGFDERYWGYCQCKPDDEGYSVKHECCGNDCDWVAPSFHIEKCIYIGGDSWDGCENDYWKYEQKYYEEENNKNTYLDNYLKEQEKIRLQEQLKVIQSRLSELN
ncbi:DUF5320 domain-containing protein [Paenibacillus sp. CMAA1739]|uniref:DUF5320 domain-containing protein n=1 Tax=Paenibacillus ottowii TaxID=2315729 RepID=UPI002DB9306D|nr:DUF5320 domain-containing protein [Paenibacillus sp. CMAA1739]MEC4565443.1 DUF5320 domain-containing protein [Paenibacillus sp. CMAA1739]